MPKVKLENEQTEKTVTENSVNETDEKLEDAAESVDMDDDDEEEAQAAQETEDARTDEDYRKETLPVVESKITEEQADEFAKVSAFVDSFMRRSIAIPGKRKRRATFSDDEAIIGDENHEMETVGSARKREYDLLSDSAKATKPKVLWGRVFGIEEMELAGTKVPFAVCNLIAEKTNDVRTENEIRSGIYKIKIPAPMFFIYDEKEYEGEEGYANLKKKMDMRVGSVIEFVVYNISMDDTEVLASRVRAMQILSYDAYLGKNKVIKPGVKAKGNITYINRHGIVVDVFGAEFFIGYNELSWRYIENALDQPDFKVGGPVVVRIKSMETAQKEIYGNVYPYMKVTGSVKDAYENPNKIYFDKYKEYQKYRGQIAFRLPQGAYIVNLGSEYEGINGNKATCICKAPSDDFGGPAYVGQNCTVIIQQKNPETFNISGAFVYREQKKFGF